MNKLLLGIASILCALMLMLSVGAPAQASSLTSAQVQAIVGLLQSFGADASVIANVQASLTGTPGVSSPTGASSSPSSNSCPVILRTLARGATGDDVTALQKFLAQDYSIYPEGLVTGYFGPATAAAVARWQMANGIAVSNADGTAGVVGPKTRTAISAKCGGGQTNWTPPPSTAPSGNVCTQEAMQCPDGSYVGRTGPSCTFAACPSISPPPSAGNPPPTPTPIPTPNPTPTVTLTQTSETTTSDGADPASADYFTVSWSSTNATSCILQSTNPSGSLTNPWATGTSGSQQAHPPMWGVHHRWIDCTGPGGTVHADLYHTVIQQQIPAVTKYIFEPNQFQGSSWHSVNGHIEGSFSNFSLWPTLISHLLANSGGFGIYAGELPYVTDATLAALHAKGMYISVDVPGFTQCADGAVIANAELNGADNVIGRQFNIVGKGWFVTKDGDPFTPDEIVQDERFGALTPLPVYTPNDKCPQAETFNAPDDRTTGLIKDYVEYSKAIRAKWPTHTPDHSLYWNVNPAYFEHAGELEGLVKAMCADGMCPTAVYMDVGYGGSPVTPQIEPQKLADYLITLRTMLRGYGVGFGIALAGDPYNTSQSYTYEQLPDHSRIITVDHPGYSPNQLSQIARVNTLDWLIRKGVVDSTTRLRFQSWTTRPQENGVGVNETIPYTLANTTNKLIQELLIPAGLAL